MYATSSSAFPCSRLHRFATMEMFSFPMQHAILAGVAAAAAEAKEKRPSGAFCVLPMNCFANSRKNEECENIDHHHAGSCWG